MYMYTKRLLSTVSVSLTQIAWNVSQDTFAVCKNDLNPFFHLQAQQSSDGINKVCGAMAGL